jgi:hypothetical protein
MYKVRLDQSREGSVHSGLRFVGMHMEKREEKSSGQSDIQIEDYLDEEPHYSKCQGTEPTQTRTAHGTKSILYLGILLLSEPRLALGT